MGMRHLHRHRRLPAAAALIGVLLYTALVTSHIVSQATFRALSSEQGADAQAAVAGDPDCHESLPAAGQVKDSKRGPLAPPRKCPFCTGYAVLHIAAVAGGPVSALPVETATLLFGIFDDGHLSGPTRAPQNRGPPSKLT